MTNINVLLPSLVLIQLLAAGVTMAMPGRARAQQIITALALTSVVILSFLLVLYVDNNGIVTMQIGGWGAPFGISLVADRLSALLVGVSGLVLLGVYFFSVGQGLADGHEETPVSIFAPTYLVLGAGVTNAFLAGDLFNLYVGFEILLVASYVLITLGGTKMRIQAGTTYVVVSLVSSVIFLVAIAFVYGATGTVNMASLSERVPDLPFDVQLMLNLVLLFAFGIKAAVFPLAFWLPDSYPTAPAPVTAVFAGLLTKVGVYSIIRTETLLFPGIDLSLLLYVVAALTLIVGILGAIAQVDIKRMLSFILISHIGYLIFGIAIGSSFGYGATTYYIVHHIIVQTTMFLAVGVIERIGGTTSLNKLGGLMKTAPFVAVLTFIPLLNLAGIPPFSGFLGKLGLFEAAAMLYNPAAYALIGVGALVSLLTLYSLARAWGLAFWRSKTQVEAQSEADPALQYIVDPNEEETVQERRDIPRLMNFATTGMVLVTILLTIFAGPIFGYAERTGLGLSDPTLMQEAVLGGESAKY